MFGFCFPREFPVANMAAEIQKRLAEAPAVTEGLEAAHERARRVLRYGPAGATSVFDRLKGAE